MLLESACHWLFCQKFSLKLVTFSKLCKKTLGLVDFLSEHSVPVGTSAGRPTANKLRRWTYINRCVSCNDVVDMLPLAMAGVSRRS